MTISACYLSTEGIVFGADSTATMGVLSPGPDPILTIHQLNHAQKVFEVGPEGSGIGITIWGLGSLGSTSFRTLIAELGDALSQQELKGVSDVADAWAQRFRKAYEGAFSQEIELACFLNANPTRTEEEDALLKDLINQYSGGFCIGGNCPPTHRRPDAYEVSFDPCNKEIVSIRRLCLGETIFRGCPNLIERLIYGVDENLYRRILESKKWIGTGDDLFDLVRESSLSLPHDLPLREAIDWIHSSILTTIKAMKFSHLPPLCGGPVEIAVVTADRPFRWVRHKRLSEAVDQHWMGQRQ